MDKGLGLGGEKEREKKRGGRGKKQKQVGLAGRVAVREAGGKPEGEGAQSWSWGSREILKVSDRQSS